MNTKDTIQDKEIYYYYMPPHSLIRSAYESEYCALEKAWEDYEECYTEDEELFLFKNVIVDKDSTYYSYFFESATSDKGTMFKTMINKADEEGEIIKRDSALESKDAFFDEFLGSYWDDAWTLHEDAIV